MYKWVWLLLCPLKNTGKVTGQVAGQVESALDHSWEGLEPNHGDASWSTAGAEVFRPASRGTDRCAPCQVGKTTPGPWLRGAGAKLQGCFKILSWTRSTDRRDSLWVSRQARLLPEQGCEELEPVWGHVKISSVTEASRPTSEGTDRCVSLWVPVQTGSLKVAVKSWS